MYYLSEIRNYLRKHSFVVVFLIAAVIALANFFVYPVFISKGLNLVSVPIAKEGIPEGTLLTQELVTTVEISDDLLPRGVIREKESVLGSYVAEGTHIPAEGFFYPEFLSDEKTSIGRIYTMLKEGEWAYTLLVPARYDQEGCLRPGQLVNLYFSGTWRKPYDDNENLEYDSQIFGLLGENLRILSVTENGENGRYVTLAVSEEEVPYLTVAENIGKVYPLVYYGSLMEKENAPESEIFGKEELRSWIESISLIERKEWDPLLDGEEIHE